MNIKQNYHFKEVKFIKKKIIIGVLVVIPILSFVIYQAKHIPADEVYLLPEDYEGCVRIYYNIEDKPALSYENNTVTYEIPDNGILKTSSPQDLGWAYEDHSGFRNVDHYYVDDNGERTKLKREDMIHAEGLGGIERTMPDGSEINLTYFHFYVGAEEQDPTESCFPSEEEIKEVPNK